MAGLHQLRTLISTNSFLGQLGRPSFHGGSERPLARRFRAGQALDRREAAQQFVLSSCRLIVAGGRWVQPWWPISCLAAHALDEDV